jgi:hypothetical protein
MGLIISMFVNYIDSMNNHTLLVLKVNFCAPLIKEKNNDTQNIDDNPWQGFGFLYRQVSNRGMDV